jgi:hypothetical protein
VRVAREDTDSIISGRWAYIHLPPGMRHSRVAHLGKSEVPPSSRRDRRCLRLLPSVPSVSLSPWRANNLASFFSGETLLPGFAFHSIPVAVRANSHQPFFLFRRAALGIQSRRVAHHMRKSPSPRFFLLSRLILFLFLFANRRRRVPKFWNECLYREEGCEKLHNIPRGL